MSSEKVPYWVDDVAHSLLQTILKKDPFTFYHCCRVGRAARKMGLAMGLPDYDLAVLEFSGLFHDIGKIGIPDHVLLKPARLEPEEFKLMQDHAEMSVQIIRPLANEAFFRHLIPGIRYHHERYDGKGYPVGLKGEKIPIFARAIAIVDTVDAMMNTRPYREALTLDHAKQELVDYSGTQFDPKLVSVYLESLPHFGSPEDESVGEVVVNQLLKSAA